MKQVVLSFLINPLLTMEVLSIIFFLLCDYMLKSWWYSNCIWLELLEHLNCFFLPLLFPYWIKGRKQHEVLWNVNRLWASDETLKCVLVAGVFLPWWGHCGEAGGHWGSMYHSIEGMLTCAHCHWSQVTVEEVMTTTAYLDLFLRSISEPALLEIFLRFILLHQHENVHILDTLTSRINTPFRVRKAPEEGNL